MFRDEKTLFPVSFILVLQPRRRLKDFQEQQRYVRKKAVEEGFEHKSKSGRVMKAKVFEIQTLCPCSRNCPSIIDVSRQKEIFDAFYQSFNWSSKTLFIRSCTNHRPIPEHLRIMRPLNRLKNRNFTNEYSLKDDSGTAQRVCKEFFCKCLQISSSRIQKALSSIKNNPAAKDRRGHASSVNKTSESDMAYIKTFISCFPKYKSHYSRKKSSKFYLNPTLTISKLYDLYKDHCAFKQRTHMSKAIFTRTFKTDFNLSFKKPKSDTCKTCDELNMKLFSKVLTDDRREEIELEKRKHLKCVKNVAREFKSDVDNALEGDQLCLSFDLQKTLETPSISASVAYYKRQLWTYNLCVYDEAAHQGYMYMWSENVASRGAQEIGSCLKYHIDHFVPVTVKHLILYSDCCGGQNRNVKITLLLKKCLFDSSHLQSIHQKYFVSGHSYNSCDRCFGMIENKRKKSAELYVPEDWKKLVGDTKKTSPQFIIIDMKSDDFFSSKELECQVINRKKDLHGEKINWFFIRSILNTKEDVLTLHIKDDEEKRTQVSLKRKEISAAEFGQTVLSNLWPEGHHITAEKYNDLQYLLKFVPENHHNFYNNLSYLKGNEDGDVGLASGYDSG